VTSVFVSYSHKDRRFVRKLNRDLEQLGVTVWLDEKALRAGDSLLRTIRDGIDKSDHFIVILSEASVSSEWVQREIDVASAIEIRTGKKKVIPVLRHTVALPVMLEGKFYADFRDNYQQGLAALRRGLRVDQRSVMLGVLIKHGDVAALSKYLLTHGYARTDIWPTIIPEIEIVSGYFASLRGGSQTHGNQFYIFHPHANLNIDDEYPVVTSKNIVIAFGKWPGTLQRVLYMFGPADEVHGVV
jgi:hypothetical protein